MAGVAIGPDDVHTRAAGNVNLDARGLFSRVERSRHSSGVSLDLGLAIAAIAGRNGIAVRAGFRMAKKSANALVELGADDVFEFAGLRMRFGVVDGKSVLEEALGEAVAADDVACAPAAHGRELHFSILHFHEAEIGHARKNPRGRFIVH